MRGGDPHQGSAERRGDRVRTPLLPGCSLPPQYLSGFEALVRLNAEVGKQRFSKIEIDMTTTAWLDADMCSPFGAILYRIGHNMNTIHLTNLRSDGGTILSKSAFLGHYGRMPVRDTYGTTIPYQRFDVKDDRFFTSYAESKFVGRSELPRMTQGFVKRFRESGFEIFSNAVIYSGTQLGDFQLRPIVPQATPSRLLCRRRRHQHSS